MKIAVCFLAVLCSVVAREIPFGTPDKSLQLDLSKLTPGSLHLEPINPVKPETVEIPGGRIIGGQEVEPHSAPHQVGVVINEATFCGGSLISTTRVLSAAHCTIRASIMRLFFGTHNIRVPEDNQVIISSTSVINHEHYNQGSFAANDVCIIFLPSEITTNAIIQIIELVGANADSFAGAQARLFGWGRTSAVNEISPVLNGINLDIISNAQCAVSFGNNVRDSSICTSGAGIVGACGGDSGGALLVNGTQVGIVSFGTANCLSGQPTVYARVSYFRDWIASNGGV